MLLWGRSGRATMWVWVRPCTQDQLWWGVVEVDRWLNSRSPPYLLHSSSLSKFFTFIFVRCSFSPYYSLIFYSFFFFLFTIFFTIFNDHPCSHSSSLFFFTVPSVSHIIRYSFSLFLFTVFTNFFLYLLLFINFFFQSSQTPLPAASFNSSLSLFFTVSLGVKLYIIFFTIFTIINTCFYIFYYSFIILFTTARIYPSSLSKVFTFTFIYCLLYVIYHTLHFPDICHNFYNWLTIFFCLPNTPSILSKFFIFTFVHCFFWCHQLYTILFFSLSLLF